MEPSVAAVLGAPGMYVDYAASKGAIASASVIGRCHQPSHGEAITGIRPLGTRSPRASRK